ncbi:hypothetical protein ACH5RR_028724 [Cinchona calisaya]|uniref:protein-serine/threonine phosphatase n=1 Tax=Cinchona calisaya TaxID=153742 RepID=A0ABD2YPM3_9GENT
MGMSRISFLAFATIFLAIFSKSAIGWRDEHQHDHDHHNHYHHHHQIGTRSSIPYECQDVLNNFDVCEAYIVGGYDEPLPQCCDGLVYLNKIAKNEYKGAFRICQCIEKIAARGGHPPYSEKRIEYLYYSCNIHLSFPISERMDCNRTAKTRSRVMMGKDILHKMKEKACFSTPLSPDAGKGKSKISKHATHGFYLLKGKSNHAMEDYLVSEFRQLDNNNLGLFAIFDGHMGHDVPKYLQSHLFDNILKEHDFWTNTEDAIRRAYHTTDDYILEQSLKLGKGGSTAVTAILINCEKLVVANVGDSRAVICKKGVAKQLSVDHEPSREKKIIESKGGFVSNLPGDVPRVDGQLAVARAFGDKSLKRHLSSEPDIELETVDDDVEFAILASDGLWKVMSNQEAVDSIKNIKDPSAAAIRLTEEALAKKSRDDISCIVVRFQ